MHFHLCEQLAKSIITVILYGSNILPSFSLIIKFLNMYYLK